MFHSSHAPSFPICHYHILHPFLLCFCVHILVQMTDAEIVSSSFVSGDPPNLGFDDTGNPLTPVFEDDTNFEVMANEEDQLQEREAAEREDDERALAMRRPNRRPTQHLRSRQPPTPLPTGLWNLSPWLSLAQAP